MGFLAGMVNVHLAVRSYAVRYRGYKLIIPLVRAIACLWTSYYYLEYLIATKDATLFLDFTHNLMPLVRPLLTIFIGLSLAAALAYPASEKKRGEKDTN